jgi:hypothetical protein
MSYAHFCRQVTQITFNLQVELEDKAEMAPCLF